MPRLILFTKSDRTISDVQAVCGPSGWELDTKTACANEETASLIAGVDAVLIDLQSPVENAHDIARQTAELSPFLPLIFLSSEGLTVEELGGGLRYHIDPSHVHDLEHVFISLTCGFTPDDFPASFDIAGNRVPRVLIVDDHAQLAGLIERNLRSFQRFDVKVAVSGFEAVAILPIFQPDVAIIDLALGDMDGRDVCIFIQNHERLGHTKVICVSGYVSEDRRSSKDFRYDAFIEKPFRMGELMDTVMGFLTEQQC